MIDDKELNCVTKILADDLANNHVSSLVQFMESASNGKLARRGKRIEITGLTRKKVKFLLRKFLHANHLSDYGVLHTASLFEIVRIRPDPKQTGNETPKTRMPFVPIHPPPTAVEPSLVIEWQDNPSRNSSDQRESDPCSSGLTPGFAASDPLYRRPPLWFRYDQR